MAAAAAIDETDCPAIAGPAISVRPQLINVAASVFIRCVIVISPRLLSSFLTVMADSTLMMQNRCQFFLTLLLYVCCSPWYFSRQSPSNGVLQRYFALSFQRFCSQDFLTKLYGLLLG
jgi:hypothetical protein